MMVIARAVPEFGRLHNRTVVLVRCFGVFSIQIGDCGVDLPSNRRARALLAYLLLNHRRRIHRDVLMDKFWPDASPEAARNCLHVALSAARRCLRQVAFADVIDRRRDTYGVADRIEVWTDVDALETQVSRAESAERAGDVGAVIEAYASAIHLAAAPLFSDDPYASWSAAARDAVELEVVRVISRLSEHELEERRFGACAATCRLGLEHDPYNEELHRRLMLAHAGLDQRHLALLQFGRCAELLDKELGVTPTSPTVQLYRELSVGESCVTPLNPRPSFR
jgi:DNA-binding SARP family transcriptional activator